MDAPPPLPHQPREVSLPPMRTTASATVWGMPDTYIMLFKLLGIGCAWQLSRVSKSAHSVGHKMLRPHAKFGLRVLNPAQCRVVAEIAATMEETSAAGKHRARFDVCTFRAKMAFGKTMSMLACVIPHGVFRENWRVAVLVPSKALDTWRNEVRETFPKALGREVLVAHSSAKRHRELFMAAAGPPATCRIVILSWMSRACYHKALRWATHFVVDEAHTAPRKLVESELGDHGHWAGLMSAQEIPFSNLRCTKVTRVEDVTRHEDEDDEGDEEEKCGEGEGGGANKANAERREWLESHLPTLDVKWHEIIPCQAESRAFVGAKTRSSVVRWRLGQYVAAIMTQLPAAHPEFLQALRRVPTRPLPATKKTKVTKQTSHKRHKTSQGAHPTPSTVTVTSNDESLTSEPDDEDIIITSSDTESENESELDDEDDANKDLPPGLRGRERRRGRRLTKVGAKRKRVDANVSSPSPSPPKPHNNHHHHHHHHVAPPPPNVTAVPAASAIAATPSPQQPPPTATAPTLPASPATAPPPPPPRLATLSRPRRLPVALKQNVAIFLPPGDPGDVLEAALLEKLAAQDPTWKIVLFVRAVAKLREFQQDARSILLIRTTNSEALNILASHVVVVRADWLNEDRYGQLLHRALRPTNPHARVQTTIVVPSGLPRLRTAYYHARLDARLTRMWPDRTGEDGKVSYSWPSASTLLMAESSIQLAGAKIEQCSSVELAAALGCGIGEGVRSTEAEGAASASKQTTKKGMWSLWEQDTRIAGKCGLSRAAMEILLRRLAPPAQRTSRPSSPWEERKEYGVCIVPPKPERKRKRAEGEEEEEEGEEANSNTSDDDEDSTSSSASSSSSTTSSVEQRDASLAELEARFEQALAQAIAASLAQP